MCLCIRWHCFLMLTACAASPQNMCGQILVFPEETKTAHVTLTTSEQTFSAVTVCLRRQHSLFSLATPSHKNAFLLLKPAAHDVIVLNVQNVRIQFKAQQYKLNDWQSICATWDSTSGLAQLWLNGKPSIKKYVGGSQIQNPSTILGQMSLIDKHTGFLWQFFQEAVFCWHDVYMWNYVLPPCEIQNYMDVLAFKPGNLINWKGLHSNILGNVPFEYKQICPKPKTCIYH
uniref:Pentraxin family member n=1 Tax=Cyclopterus lumpus TaxID=8103 RepID=A0A8C2WVJ8_CYCLU